MRDRVDWEQLLIQIGALDVLLSDPRPAVPLTDDARMALETSRATLREKAFTARKVWGFAPAVEDVAA